MGKAKRTRMSQRMSQHIMQLKLALRIESSAGITYQDGMYIAHKISLVNTFFLPKFAASAERLSEKPLFRRFRRRRFLVIVQKMMPDPVLLIGNHRAEVDIGNTFEDVRLDLRICVFQGGNQLFCLKPL